LVPPPDVAAEAEAEAPPGRSSSRDFLLMRPAIPDAGRLLLPLLLIVLFCCTPGIVQGILVARRRRRTCILQYMYLKNVMTHLVLVLLVHACWYGCGWLGKWCWRADCDD